MIKILLIDDGRADAQALVRELCRRGYDVVSVAGGKAGCEELAAGDFALVISGLTLPSLDGLVVHTFARQTAHHRDTKFIFVSVAASLRAAIPGLSAGKDYFHDDINPLASMTALVSSIFFGTFAGKWV
jgi:DNA-binding response OmpR family regulator